LRILGIDPGDKRIGLALTDPSGTIASPLQVLAFTSRAQAAQEIKKLVIQYDIKLIVVGAALDETGGETPASRKARRLGDELANLTGISVVYEDEADTTNEAQQAARSAGYRQKQRQGHLDQLAAAILLQRYLEKEATKKGPDGA